MKLHNKVCLITGSSRGIGSAIARAYAAEGAKVVITYNNNKKEGIKLSKELGAIAPYKLNVTKKKNIQSVFKSVYNKLGRIDVLVNNAGTNITNDFDKLSEKDWDTVVDVNLKGVFLCCQEVLKSMPNGGKIINIGSLSGEYGGPRTPSYAAAKAGVMSLTHCLARFVGKKRINVNCISPGVIDNDFTSKTMSKNVKGLVKNLLLIPRLGKLNDLTGAVVFLASNESNYITGQTISINGGAWVR
jgi:NAD(P)-dependent dehydrogenase (short-subunit alcohol dehydrogenase family)